MKSGLLLCVLVIFFTYGVCGAETIEVGEVWEYCIDRDNPFKPMDCERYKILGVENGYVQYYTIVRYGNVVVKVRRIESRTTGWFKTGSERLVGLGGGK